jgi:hypothetical protein
VGIILKICGGIKANGGETVNKPIDFVDFFQYFNLVSVQVIFPKFESDSLRCPVTEVVITDTKNSTLNTYPSGFIKSFDPLSMTIDVNT